MFRPCIDLHEGKVKQIVGGSLKDSGKGIIENFVSDKTPAYYAELFAKDKLKGGHVIMLGKGNEAAALEAIRTYPEALQVGGGINPDNAEMYLKNGASHVIVTSYIFSQGRLDMNKLEKLVNAVGKEKLVIDISCRKKQEDYYVVTDRWQTFTDFKVTPENIRLLESYCDELLVHGVDVEGKQQGIDTELIELLAENASIPTTYAGGIRSLEDIKTINKIGKGKINYTVGSALTIFGGKLSYELVVENQEVV